MPRPKRTAASCWQRGAPPWLRALVGVVLLILLPHATAAAVGDGEADRDAVRRGAAAAEAEHDSDRGAAFPPGSWIHSVSILRTAPKASPPPASS